MEFKWYGKHYDELDLVVERYIEWSDCYVCSIPEDEYDDIGWVTVRREAVELRGTELVATRVMYIGTSKEMDDAA